MRTGLSLVMFSSLTLAWTASAATHYVVPPGTPGIATAPNYTSWATAATNIAHAVGVATNNSLVLVSNGTYRLPGTLSITTGITLRSYKAGATDRAGTILDGGFPVASNRCLLVNHANAIVDGFTITNGYSATLTGVGVCLLKGVVSNSTIVGCTSTFNNGGGGGAYVGTGGLLAHCLVAKNTALHPTENQTISGGGVYLADGGIVSNCVIHSNRARDGGGINMVSGSITAPASGLVIGCVVSNNVAAPATGLTLAGGSGGGIRMYRKGAIIDCKVSGNQARPSAGGSGSSGYGAGVVVGEGGVMRDSLIYQNTGSSYGGGVSVGRGCVASNCLIRNNSANYGGGVYVNSTGFLLNCMIVSNNNAMFVQNGTLRNCLIAHNSAGVWGQSTAGGYYQNCTIVSNVGTGIRFSVPGTVVNSIVYHNSAAANYSYDGTGAGTTWTNSCTFPFPPGASDTGNIANAPRLVNYRGFDFRLRGSSPCINKGVYRTWMAGARDLAGGPRIRGDVVDIGAYEHKPVGTSFQVR